MLAVAAGLLSQTLMVVLLSDPFGGGGPDSTEYARHAENLLDHGLYSFDGVHPDRMRQPLYPTFIAAVYAVFGRDNLHVYVVQILIGCVSIWMTWLLARRLGLSAPGAGLAGLLLAMYPPWARLAGMIMTETCSTLFWLATAPAFVTLVGAGRDRDALVMGAVIGLHTLCRPASFLFLPLFCGAILLAGFTMRRAVRLGLLTLMAFGLVMLPWGIRNVMTLGHATILSAEGGVSLFIAMRADREEIWRSGMGKFVDSPEVQTLIQGAYPISSAAAERFAQEGWRLLRQDPIGSIYRGLLGSVKAWLYAPGGLTVTRNRPWLWGPVVAIPTTLFLASLYGGLSLPGLAARVLIVALPLYFTLAHIAAPSHPRLVLPLFPFTAIGATAGFDRLRKVLHDA